jgi:outer membrane lipoprotein SlyB
MHQSRESINIMTTKLKISTIISLIAVALSILSLTGCVHTADIVKALAQDTNSIRLNVTTIYGTITLERNLPYKTMLIP